MCRKLVFSSCIVLLVGFVNAVCAGEFPPPLEYPGPHIELKIDLAYNTGEPDYLPDPVTYKGGDWIALTRWSDDQPHDTQSYLDIGGSGINFGIGMGRGDSYTKLKRWNLPTDAEPICNTFMIGKHEVGEESGGVQGTAKLVLWGDPLPPGEYWVYGYHNYQDVNDLNDIIPEIIATTYRWSTDDKKNKEFDCRCLEAEPNDTAMQNIGATPETLCEGGDCVGVIQIHDEDTCDVNVPIQKVTLDSLLVPSLVKFTTDESTVIIHYVSPTLGTSALNAVILLAPIPRTAWNPTPRPGTDGVCPDVELTWNPGVYVTTHRVYFGSDFPETLPLFDDGFESGFEPNWTSSGWEWYDANAVNPDPNLRHSGDYSARAVGAGVKTLTSGDIDANEAGAMEVDFYVRKTEEQLQFGELELYYYDGSSYNFIADLNEPGFGPNDVWLHYNGEITDSNYMISNFRIQLRANISTGDVIYVDDASVTNTWVLSPIWFRGEQSAGETSYDPCGFLDFNETYYWRVDEVNEANQPDPWQGRYWSFTTEIGKASDPSPLDGQWSIATDANLSWAPSCLVKFHDVYFGTDFNDVNSATDPNSGPGQGRIDANDPNNLIFDPCGLEEYTRYYWRVDQVGESTFVKGDVWTFHTIGGMLFYFDFEGVLDANIHDPCDELQVTDSNGNVTFEIRGNNSFLRYDEPNPLWNPDGTSADLASKKKEDDDHVGLYRGEFSRPRVRGPDITDLTAPAYTIEMWIMPEDLGPFYDDDDNLITSIGLFRKWKRSYVVDINDNRTVRFTHDGNTIESADPNDRLKEGPWYHIAAVFDSNDPIAPQKLYIDSLLVASGGTTATNPLDDDDPVSIGVTIRPAWDSPKGYEQNSGWFKGRIDELRVFDVALDPSNFAFRGDFGLAWYPTPRDREKEVYRHVDFEWRPGDYSDRHKVFFGESWEDVNGMTDPCAETLLGNEFWEPGPLDLDFTYYWRVDEVNDTNGYTWKGLIWKFTTADYNVIDDFELYNKTTNQIHNTWRDYQWQSVNTSGEETGALLDLGEDPYDEVHTGEQSMTYTYLNYPCGQSWCPPGCGDIPPGYGIFGFGYAYVYYSEAWLPVPAAKRDWTIADVKALTLYFYGDPDNDTNDTEQMYLGVEDGDGNYAEVRYGDYAAFEDMNDLKLSEWQAWNIDMTHFNDSNHAAVPNDVDPCNIVTLYLGFGDRRNPLDIENCGGQGRVIFDDIRLYVPRCVPEYGPVGDFSGDCIVGLADIEMMQEYFLRTDHNYVGMMQDPGTTGLVGWWKLDGNADDSSISAHHGTMEGDFMWARDRDGVANTAVKFLANKNYEGKTTGGRVLIPDAAHLKPINKVSVSAWINLEDPDDSGRIVVKGGKDREAYVLEAEDDELQFFIRDQNSSWKPSERFERKTLDHNRPFPLNEWIHVAGTYDGNVMALYESGQQLTTSQDLWNFAVKDRPNDPNFLLSQDVNDLAIGNVPLFEEDEPEGSPFIGYIDEVRIYDRGLEPNEVRWLATDGGGYAPLLLSEFNLYDKEVPDQKAINFKDYAMLLENWLVEIEWP